SQLPKQVLKADGIAVDVTDADRCHVDSVQGLNGFPCLPSHASSRFVQSQPMHAHGSEPFSSRHALRACASLMESNSKNSSQYGRSSCSGVAQKQVSTHLTRPSASARACAMSRRYSPPAMEPSPSDPSSMARRSASRCPCLSRSVTRYRMSSPAGPPPAGTSLG